jgi:hypothetical protein
VAVGPDEIVRSDVEAAVPIAVDELDTGFFQARIGRTTDAERAYLVAMASLGIGPYNSGEVAAAMGKTHNPGWLTPRRAHQAGPLLFATPRSDRVYGANVRSVHSEAFELLAHCEKGVVNSWPLS